jgi:hypothetical protein
VTLAAPGTGKPAGAAACTLSRRVIFLCLSGSLGSSACRPSTVPDPRDAARAYSDAAKRGDATSLYAMMSASSRLDRRKEDVAKMLADERVELAEQGAAIAEPGARVTATARIRYADGEEAALDLRGGRYWVTAAGALPGGGRTPEEALEQLRRVLARRSYAGLMRVLSPATRAAVENDMRSFVEGLNDTGALPVQVTGDAALVPIPGGHQVKLRREGGIWRIEDFD